MQSEWLKKIEFELPEILKIVKSCDLAFRPKCFELLLSHALNSTNLAVEKHIIQPGKDSGQKTNQNKQAPQQNQNTDLNPKFLRFLSENELTLGSINNLIDLETGEVIGTKLGKNGPETTRNIAVLLALWNCSKDGDFLFKASELKEKTNKYGIAFHNQKRDIQKAVFEGKKVFIENGENWRIPTPTQGFMVKTLKELIS